jgi:hypothetical protein
LNALYCLLAWYYWGLKDALILAVFLPILGYAGYNILFLPRSQFILLKLLSVRMMEAGIGEFRLLLAIFRIQAARDEINSLEHMRADLRERIRHLVDELGPQLRIHSLSLLFLVSLIVLELCAEWAKSFGTCN